MPNVFGFKGLTYNPAVVQDLGHVVVPPYGQYADELGAVFARRHPYNVTRLHGAAPEPGGAAADPGALLRSWIAEGVLVREARPVLYAYHQDYVLGHMEQRLCKGFVCLCGLEEYSLSGIFPHERTFPGPLQARVEGLERLGGTFGPVMLAYRDAEQRVESLLAPFCQGSPALRTIDDSGVLHMLWRIDDEAVIRAVQDTMKGKSCLIADGHHRYEAALQFRNKMRAAGRACEGADSFENILATMINIDQPGGLTILPTHRVVSGAPGFDAALLLQKLKRHFAVYDYPAEGGRTDLLEDLRFEGHDSQVFALIVKGDPNHYLLRLQDAKGVQMFFAPQTSATMRGLDAVLLHEVVLEKFMGISHKDGKHKQFVSFERSAETAIRRVEEEDAQCVFLMNPLKAEQVQEIAHGGQLLPQKSTDFHPKVLTGLIGQQFDYIK